MRLFVAALPLIAAGTLSFAVPAVANENHDHGAAETQATEAQAAEAPAAAPAAAKPAAKEEKKICKTIAATGSRTGGQKVCMTRAEWKKVDL